MKLDDFLAVLEKVGPLSLSDEFCKKHDAYDNSGIIIKSGEEVNGAVFSLDLSHKTVERAKALGYNLIVTHHPAIFYPIRRLDAVTDPKGSAVPECIKNVISVISMHLNFDVAPQGIDYHLMKGLGGNDAQTLVQLSGGAYGRIYEIKPQNFKEYFNAVKKTFSSERAICFGKDKVIKRVASFCGAGCDDKAIEFAYKNKADVFVSGDICEHEIAALVANGINVIELTHYSSENYGFNKIYQSIKEKLKVPSEYFCDDELL